MNYELFYTFATLIQEFMSETIKIPNEWNQFYLKDVSFMNLMTRRIFNILIVFSSGFPPKNLSRTA